MLTVRIIPCLDVKDGQVVKGVRFQNLRDAGSPAELARLYEEQGADELVLLDISATQEGRAARLSTVEAVRRELSIPLTVGGGIQSLHDVQSLLEHGADRVSVNTAAVLRPQLVDEMASRFGTQCTVVAMDVRQETEGRFRVVVRSGTRETERDAQDWAREIESRGAGEILLTSMDRDGTRDGYDLELLRTITSVVAIPVIASGGAAGPEHLVDAVRAGASAVLAASLFHDSDYTVSQVKQSLLQQEVEVRS